MLVEGCRGKKLGNIQKKKMEKEREREGKGREKEEKEGGEKRRGE